MIKVLLDTSVWIRYLRIRSTDEDGTRHKKANELFNYLLTNHDKYIICYSERSRNELNNDKILAGFSMIGSHCFNLPIEEIDLVWDNIQTKWGDESEVEYGDKLEELLPYKKNNNDRGIFGDAVYENCQIIIHEDKDFLQFIDESKYQNIVLINLLKITAQDCIDQLEQLFLT